MPNNVVSETANAKWSKIAENWKTLGPPAKPSKQEIELYKAITLLELSDKDKARAVIMGSTPELREMCSEFFSDKFESVVCVDVTEDMYHAMSKLIKQKNPKEKFVHGNWLNLKDFFETNSIDIIYGDHVVSNVGGKESELFDNIKSILKENGCFTSKIQHVDTTDENIKPISAY